MKSMAKKNIMAIKPYMPGKPIEEVRKIRDQIEQKVKDFIVSMTKKEPI